VTEKILTLSLAAADKHNTERKSGLSQRMDGLVVAIRQADVGFHITGFSGWVNLSSPGRFCLGAGA
jgi:hypothetical protein